MTVFWAIAATLTLVALLFVFVPLLRSGKHLQRPQDEDTRTASGPGTENADPQDDQLRTSVDIYRSQLAELETDLDNGTLSREQFDKARLDLQRSLLEAGDQAGSRQQRHPGVSWRLPAGVSVLIMIPLLAFLIYDGFGAGAAAIDPEPARAQPGDSEAQFEAEVMSLRARLEQNPQDPEGWLTLARSYTLMGEDTDSMHAYEQAIRYGADQDPNVLVTYADMLAAEDDNDLNQRALPYVHQALEVEPEHTDALWFSGLAAFQRADFETARERWQRLLPQFPEDAPEAQVIRRQLTEIENRLAAEESDAREDRD
ncbi:c-type cytochrome biogenesis protein CcmI [Thioalkalivibrio sp. ALJT]|uniref:c-type cytochrome biogenesis protein CcmI n=1 Tax=Thioalkalivibrio sp. ALJT TaxID=1158146 RepID=UPI0003709A64|nr:c-type cytochrome biogenesis protein CcmI [Thioalkalivibrio sp. ALJT]